MLFLLKPFKSITQTRLILGVTLLFALLYNLSFFRNVIEVYPLNSKYLPFLASLAVLLTCAIFLQLALLCCRYTIKPVLIVLLLLSALCSYFMDSYNVIIDSGMLSNVVQTDLAEALDLFSFKLVGYVAVLGILPSLYVYKVKIRHSGFKRELVTRLKTMALALVIAAVSVVMFSDYYASFFREHKPLRYYANPTCYLYGTYKYVRHLAPSTPREVKAIGLDAKTPDGDDTRELVVFVVGETARSDRFSLNGYSRETNPLLKAEQVVSFTDFWACGTSTAISVPCMFSAYGESDFSESKASATENLLDVLTHAGVNVLWLDNNSGSKGVADRVDYANYKSPELNPDCDQECRDVGMLAHFDEYIKEHPKGDIFIVMHQMGTHGPAYYKRYPPSFEKFTPVCRTNQLEECSVEEIGNTYDNTILYTDYFLSRIINLLKQYDDRFETAMLYISDHGESLGENGVYLHGMPNFVAPEEQRKVPAILWLGKKFSSAERMMVAAQKDYHFSHDHIFSTVLGMMEVQTSLYDRSMDILSEQSR